MRLSKDASTGERPRNSTLSGEPGGVELGYRSREVSPADAMLPFVSNGSSGAFGRIPESSTRYVNGAEVRADDRASLEPWPSDLREHLDAGTANLLSSFQFMIASASADMHLTNSGAAYMVLTHATNDALALLDEVVSGSGRAAARTARGMLEHLINYADVTTSTENAERYVSHRHVTDELIGQRALYFRSAGRERTKRATKVQRAMLRASRLPLAEALSKYGHRFRLGFTPVTLKDRAERFGYAEAYDGYRILSGVMHGAAGGLLGTSDMIRGEVVHRVGPDLRLAAIAYVEGLTWWCQLLERVVVRGTSSRIDALLEASVFLRDAWPEVSDALQSVDRKLWPVQPPTPMHTILALYPNGERWYVHRPVEQSLTLAEPPFGDDVEKVLREARHIYANYRPEQFGGRPMTIAVPHITVDETPGAPGLPSAGILVPSDVRKDRGGVP